MTGVQTCALPIFTNEMGEVKVNVESVKQEKGIAWGALYWQYFEQLDKITPAETPLKLTKKLFLEKSSPTGPVITPISNSTLLHPGDRIKVRVELSVDRAMEFVHMKDMRASGFEPENVISQYKYQGGLGYYESTRDAATTGRSVSTRSERQSGRIRNCPGNPCQRFFQPAQIGRAHV